MHPVRVLVVDDPQGVSARDERRHGRDRRVCLGGLRGVGRGIDRDCEGLRPDLVVMDVNLPGIDGMEATRRLRADSAVPDVVLLSTYDEDDWGGQAQECGAVAYVAKSAFGPDQLRAVWAMTAA